MFKDLWRLSQDLWCQPLCWGDVTGSDLCYTGTTNFVKYFYLKHITQVFVWLGFCVEHVPNKASTMQGEYQFIVVYIFSIFLFYMIL